MPFVSPMLAIPPLSTSYHLYCPSVPPAAVNTAVPSAHTVTSDAEGGANAALSVAVTGTLSLSQEPLLIAT